MGGGGGVNKSRTVSMGRWSDPWSLSVDIWHLSMHSSAFSFPHTRSIVMPPAAVLHGYVIVSGGRSRRRSWSSISSSSSSLSASCLVYSMNQYLGLQVHLGKLERMKQLMSFFALPGYLQKGEACSSLSSRFTGPNTEIMKEVHDKIGYRGQGTTFDQVKGCTSGRKCSDINGSCDFC